MRRRSAPSSTGPQEPDEPTAGRGTGASPLRPAVALRVLLRQREQRLPRYRVPCIDTPVAGPWSHHRATAFVAGPSASRCENLALAPDAMDDLDVAADVATGQLLPS